ncbi:hypothetical protein ACFQ60_01045 [Streptomyces zhihengii]
MALAPPSLVLAVGSVIVLVTALAVFVTPGDNGMERERILVPVPGAVTICVVLIHLFAAILSSWVAWPTWAAVVVTALAATSLIAEQPRWRSLLAGQVSNDETRHSKTRGRHTGLGAGSGTGR